MDDGSGSDFEFEDYQVDMSNYPDLGQVIDELFGPSSQADAESVRSSTASELSDYHVDMSLYPDVNVDGDGDDYGEIVVDEEDSDVDDNTFGTRSVTFFLKDDFL